MGGVSPTITSNRPKMPGPDRYSTSIAWAPEAHHDHSPHTALHPRDVGVRLGRTRRGRRRRARDGPVTWRGSRSGTSSAHPGECIVTEEAALVPRPQAPKMPSGVVSVQPVLCRGHRQPHQACRTSGRVSFCVTVHLVRCRGN